MSVLRCAVLDTYNMMEELLAEGTISRYKVNDAYYDGDDTVIDVSFDPSVPVNKINISVTVSESHTQYKYMNTMRR